MGEAETIAQGWLADGQRKVWVIDETKINEQQLALQGHKELFLFTIICVKACDIVQFGALADTIREEMASLAPDDPNRDGFKSAELWGAFAQGTGGVLSESLKRYADSLAGVLNRSERVVQLVTTQKNIENLKSSSKTISIGEDGQAKRIPEQKHLDLIQNVILTLAHDWGIEKLDVILDRSDGFGMSPKQAKIGKDHFNVYSGILKGSQHSIDLTIIAGDDHGVTFRDPLLLPDFFGFIIRDNFDANLGNVLPSILNGSVPFYVHRYDVGAMIAHQRNASSATSPS